MAALLKLIVISDNIKSRNMRISSKKKEWYLLTTREKRIQDNHQKLQIIHIYY